MLVYSCSQIKTDNMLTFRVEVLKNKQKSDGTYNVKIRMTYKRVVKRLSTSIFVRSTDLTKSFKLKNPKFIKEAEDIVKYYQEVCATLPLETSSYTMDEILEYIKSEQERHKPIDFIQFGKGWLETTEIKGKKNYKSAINAFITYIGQDGITINQVTKELLKGFMRYLLLKRMERVAVLEKQGKRIPSNRMVSLYLTSLRHLFNEAKKEYNDYDRNIIRISNSPFENLEIPKQELTRKRALSAELIRAIWHLPYILNANGKERICPFNLAKDCFILSFCLIGMNSVDLYNCPIQEANAIVYYRTKTADRRLDKAKMKVIIPSILVPLLNKYRDYTGKRLFRFYHSYSSANNFNKAINVGLKEVGKLLKIDDLEYYAARHSWATLAVNSVGIDKYTVHAALNHIDEAMKVTDIYIDRDFKIENEANKKVLQYVFGDEVI